MFKTYVILIVLFVVLTVIATFIPFGSDTDIDNLVTAVPLDGVEYDIIVFKDAKSEWNRDDDYHTVYKNFNHKRYEKIFTYNGGNYILSILPQKENSDTIVFVKIYSDFEHELNDTIYFELD